jgi:hypothetical protein
MRAAVPEFFNDRDVTRPELKEILNLVWVSGMPVALYQLRRLFIKVTGVNEKGGGGGGKGRKLAVAKSQNEVN